MLSVRLEWEVAAVEADEHAALRWSGELHRQRVHRAEWRTGIGSVGSFEAGALEFAIGRFERRANRLADARLSKEIRRASLAAGPPGRVSKPVRLSLR